MVQFLDGLFSAALNAEVFPSGHYVPDLYSRNNYERRADGWAASQGLGAEWRESRGAKDVLDFEIRLDGGGQLFCGRAAEMLQSERFVIFENIVAGLTARFLAVLGGLYAASDYLGSVDVGLAVTGLKGGISFELTQRIGISPIPFDRDQYRRTERLSATTLNDDPRSAASKLVLPLARATTRESYDPYSNQTS